LLDLAAEALQERQSLPDEVRWFPTLALEPPAF
jgi:hypothetical protein